MVITFEFMCYSFGPNFLFFFFFLSATFSEAKYSRQAIKNALPFSDHCGIFGLGQNSFPPS